MSGDPLLHPPDARPRAPPRDFVPCTYGVLPSAIPKCMGTGNWEAGICCLIHCTMWEDGCTTLWGECEEGILGLVSRVMSPSMMHNPMGRVRGRHSGASIACDVTVNDAQPYGAGARKTFWG